jgi:hypothetical protein
MGDLDALAERVRLDILAVMPNKRTAMAKDDNERLFVTACRESDGDCLKTLPSFPCEITGIAGGRKIDVQTLDIFVPLFRRGDGMTHVILAHTHPRGSALYPSPSDARTTIAVEGVLTRLGIVLADHVIFDLTEPRSQSMRKLGFLGWESENWKAYNKETNE